MEINFHFDLSFPEHFLKWPGVVKCKWKNMNACLHLPADLVQANLLVKARDLVVSRCLVWTVSSFIICHSLKFYICVFEIIIQFSLDRQGSYVVNAVPTYYYSSEYS